MDNREQRNWDDLFPHKEDLNNNPYHNQQTHSEYKGQGFAIASFVFGMIALLLNCVPFLPLIPASFGMLFAALSYRKGKRVHRMASNGVLTSGFAIASAVFTLVQLLAVLSDPSQVAAYQQQIQEFMQQMP